MLNLFGWLRMDSIKKVLREILQTSQEKTCAGLSFLTKSDAVDRQLHQNRDSCTGVFLWVLQSFKDTFFAEHDQATASDHSRTDSGELRIGLVLLL